MRREFPPRHRQAFTRQPRGLGPELDDGLAILMPRFRAGHPAVDGRARDADDAGDIVGRVALVPECEEYSVPVDGRCGAHGALHQPSRKVAQCRIARASAALSESGLNPRRRASAIIAALSTLPLPVQPCLMTPTPTGSSSMLRPSADISVRAWNAP